jgi:hypothetical protein
VVAPFNSDKFYTDAFFGLKNALIQSKTVTCILIDSLDPKRQGNLIDRPGHWGRIYIRTKDATKPNPSDFIVIDGETWKVDSSNEQGDQYEVIAVTNQRKS